MNIFELASKHKLRFDTPKGMLTVEDLWDLPLETNNTKLSLNDVAIACDEELQKVRKSFVSGVQTKDLAARLRMDVVLRVIELRKEEIEAKTKATTVRQQNSKIDELIAQKENERLAGLSIEELKALKK